MLDTEKLASALRRKRGETPLGDASQDSGIPKTSLSRMERGVGSPSVENLIRACSWLGVTVEELRTDRPAQAA